MPTTTHFKPRTRGRWRWVWGAIIVLLLALVSAPAVIGGIVRNRLAATLRKDYSIEVNASSAWYLAPWGMSLHGVRVTRILPDGSRSEVFSAARVVVKLARYPKAGQALAVEHLTIDSPSVTITRRVAEQTPPVAAAPAAGGVSVAAESAAAPRHVQTASERLRIYDFSVTNGRFAYLAQGYEPFVLDHITFSAAPSAGSPQSYKFSLAADQAAASQIHSSGSIDIDDFNLAISDLSFHANAAAVLTHVPLSQPLRRTLAAAKLGGMLDVSGSALVPLRDLQRATFAVDVQLHGGRATLPGAKPMRIDNAVADMSVHRQTGYSGIAGEMRNLVATAGGTQLFIDDARLSTADDGQSWRLAGLRGRLNSNGGVPALDHCQLRGQFIFTGAANGPTWIPAGLSASDVIKHELIFYPRSASVQPWSFPIPVNHIEGGPITCRAGVVKFENLTGNYGGDRVLLNQAHITLDDPRQQTRLHDLRQQIRIEGIDGTLVCHQPGPLYPAALAKVFGQLRPSGPFIIGGGSWFAINRPLPGETQKLHPDFFFRVSSVKGAFALTDHQAPLTDIRGDATVSPMRVNITQLRANFLGGTVIGSGIVTPVPPIHYEAAATFYNVNLQLAQRQLRLNSNTPMVGEMYLKAQASGFGKGAAQTPLESLAASGEFEIAGGSFGQLTAVRAAAGKVAKPDQPLDGTAAGVFAISHSCLDLENCAIGNPLFGLQGSGRIGFDKKLDLHAVAAPLGDWQVALKHSNLPVLADVGSDIAGAIQQMFNGAQRLLLWDIHISGTVSAPKVEITPAPVITEPLAALFAQMIQGDKNPHLIERVRPATQPQKR